MTDTKLTIERECKMPDYAGGSLPVAKSKIDHLHERGYERVAVVMSKGSGDRAIVSNMGRVTWHGEATDQYIRGGSHE